MPTKQFFSILVLVAQRYIVDQHWVKEGMCELLVIYRNCSHRRSIYVK